MRHGHSQFASPLQQTARAMCAVAALSAVLFGTLPAHGDEGEIAPEGYYTYHNSLAGVLIASQECAAHVLDGQNGATVLDALDDTLGISTTAPAFWVYDGMRTWTVRRVLVVGPYARYEVDDSDCILYTNSHTVEAMLDVLAVSKTNWYGAHEYSLPRVDAFQPN